MNTWRIIRALWGIGNYWARWAIIIVASWPILITLAAFTGYPAFTATVTFLPLTAVVFGLIAVFDPLIIAAIGIKWPSFLKTVSVIVGGELALGVYFAAVPVANDRGLIPVALIAWLAIFFLSVSKLGLKKIVSALLFALAVITAVFFLGGRARAGERIENLTGKTTSATSTETSRILAVGRGWLTIPLAEYRSFDFLPLDGPVLIRRVDGAVFERRPDRTLLRVLGGGRQEVVEDMGKPIPGYSVDLSSKSGAAIKVVFTMRPTGGR